jgi:hypothetical protein
VGRELPVPALEQVFEAAAIEQVFDRTGVRCRTQALSASRVSVFEPSDEKLCVRKNHFCSAGRLLENWPIPLAAELERLRNQYQPLDRHHATAWAVLPYLSCTYARMMRSCTHGSTESGLTCNLKDRRSLLEVVTWPSPKA